ncbi:hypothetical protein BDZ89DRAFT_720938 [Hymenopellis radicata]|nr:hypothetical protein BDZ89DRAFT_720938 [Hymenopellis radicata]
MTEIMEKVGLDTNDVPFTRTDSPSAFISQDFRQPSEDDDSEGDKAAPKGWRCGDPLHHEIPKSGDPWESCLALTRQYDQDMCRGWNEETDTLLVFAGLFSAVVTAFTIEAYQWLENNAEDISVTLLAQISNQLASLSPNSTSQVPLTTTSSSSTSQSVSENSATRINIYWFLSLTLSLTSALLSILCKQWLREYMRETSQTPKSCIGIRQMRYEGLWKWQVPNIIASLPLLLQSALVLFFAGILELLWNLRPLIAAVMTIVIGLVFTFVLITTVAPFFQWLLFFIWPSSTKELPSQCAYKSPQSWAVLRFGTWMAQLLVLLPAVRLASSRQSSRGSIFEEFKSRLRGVYDEQWVGYDYDCVFHHDLMGKGNYVARGLTWIDKTFGDQHTALQIWHCLRDLKPSDASQVVQRSCKGMQEVISARVSELVPPLLDLAASMDNPHDGNDISKEVTSMAYFMLYHSDDRSPYLPSCIEQCLRTLNTAPEDPPIPASLFDCLLVHLDNMKGPISDGTFPFASQCALLTISD